MTVWWEKTVEYKFVLEFLRFKDIKPLDGKHEQAIGDALIRGDFGISIIEFKRHFGTIYQENEKYGIECRRIEYIKYSDEIANTISLEAIDIPHYIVYGIKYDTRKEIEIRIGGKLAESRLSTQSRNELRESIKKYQDGKSSRKKERPFSGFSLACCTYWTLDDVTLFDISENKNLNNNSKFFHYVSKLIELRMGSTQSGRFSDALAIVNISGNKLYASLQDIIDISQILLYNPTQSQNENQKNKSTPPKNPGK
ncbi:hypothetical protein [uncultured Methylobacterium sp.]|uniref:hypothetical protein n=1 Tax=uncultured Methylobacterium sp. TaxID=157278 RepID=UPI00259A54A1|nr:hypothetical protein [uncultured Methylobacterium sp.]